MAAVGDSLPAEQHVYLEVIVNGRATHLVGTFRQRREGKLAVTPAEFAELGLRSDPDSPGADGLLDLDRLSGVAYRIDTVAQLVRFEVTEIRLRVRHFDARGDAAPVEEDAKGPAPRPGYGAVLNYLLYGTSNSDLRNLFSATTRQSAFSAALDGRAFSPFGVFSQSLIAGLLAESSFSSIRLDTTWSYSDPHSLVTYRAGDIVSGGLTWTRPTRLGGFQIQRNFALRPDLVTMPVPQVTGSAVVPSTVDVYVNNIRTYSRDVPPGPFEISNLPIISGVGTQRIVLRDALGREIVTNQPYYASSQLLRTGLFDFSAEVGYRRLYYGILSNSYDPDVVASSSLRYGLSNVLTVEAHVEGGTRLANGGLGIVFPLVNRGIASLALAGSSADGKAGTQYTASIEFEYRSITFFARTQRTAGNFADIASIYARPLLPLDGIKLTSLRPPKALDQVALSIPLGFDRSLLSLNFTHLTDFENGRFRILSASYNRSLSPRTSLFATVFKSLGGQKNTGIYLGISHAFGSDVSASANLSTGPGQTTAGIEIAKAQPADVGSYGWRVRDYEGATPNRLASASYRASFARMQASAEQYGPGARVSAEMEGAIAIAGGGVFFANRISDAFAVVDAGAPGVDVLYENRPIGTTDRHGRLLVPDLRAYQKNILAIDTKNLPIDADIQRTKQIVVPADRSGIVVDFGVSTRAQTAILTLRDAKGEFIPPGSQGTLDGTKEAFVVGYDGKAYLRGLQPDNAITVERADGGPCRARFAYTARAGVQVAIESVCG